MHPDLVDLFGREYRGHQIFIPKRPRRSGEYLLCEEQCPHSPKPGILVTDLLAGEGPYPHNKGVTY